MAKIEKKTPSQTPHTRTTFNRYETWFAHRVDSTNDDKMLPFFIAFGHEGKGVYWDIIELLRAAPDYRIPITSIPHLPFMLRYSGTPERFDLMFNLLLKQGLIRVENDSFFSTGLCKNMVPLDMLKDLNRKKSKAYWDSKKDISIPRDTHGKAAEIPIYIHTYLHTDDTTPVKGVVSESMYVPTSNGQKHPLTPLAGVATVFPVEAVQKNEKEKKEKAERYYENFFDKVCAFEDQQKLTPDEATTLDFALCDLPDEKKITFYERYLAYEKKMKGEINFEEVHSVLISLMP